MATDSNALRDLRDAIAVFMTTPIELHPWGTIVDEEFTHDSTMLGSGGLLGDKFTQHIRQSLDRVFTFCEFSRELRDRVSKSKDYLDSVTEAIVPGFNGVKAFLPPGRTIFVVPEEASRSYTLGKHNPVDSLLDLITVALPESPEISVIVSAAALAKFARCTDRLIRKSLEECPKATRGTKGKESAWLYSNARPWLLKAVSPTVRACQWPEKWPPEDSKIGSPPDRPHRR